MALEVVMLERFAISSLERYTLIVSLSVFQAVGVFKENQRLGQSSPDMFLG
jgi:hypothetical protein